LRLSYSVITLLHQAQMIFMWVTRILTWVCESATGVRFLRNFQRVDSLAVSMQPDVGLPLAGGPSLDQIDGRTCRLAMIRPKQGPRTRRDPTGPRRHADQPLDMLRVPVGRGTGYSSRHRELASTKGIDPAQVRGHGGRFQIWSAYSRIVRSLENKPHRAVLRTAIRAHFSRSR